MSAPYRTPIAKESLVHVNAFMLIVTSLFVFLRAVLHVAKRKTFEPQDIFIYFAYILYVSLWGCYIAAIPSVYRFNTFNGVMNPYSTTMEDATNALKLIMAAQTCYYTLLLSVKMSLLTLYRKLLIGLPYVYNKIWWAIVVFCIAAWIGSIISSLFICDDFQETSSICTCGENANEVQKIVFSLYFSYALDVMTNLLIVLFPMHIIWNLQMTKLQKIGVFLLFGSDSACIIFATLRVVRLGLDGRGKVAIPDPSRMLLWTVIECSVAVIVGCLPTFASLIRAQINNYSKTTCTAHRCIQRSIDAWRKRSEASSKFRLQRDNPDLCWNVTYSSQDELASDSTEVEWLNESRVRAETDAKYKDFGGQQYERRGAEDFSISILQLEDPVSVHLVPLRY